MEIYQPDFLNSELNYLYSLENYSTGTKGYIVDKRKELIAHFKDKRLTRLVYLTHTFQVSMLNILEQQLQGKTGYFYLWSHDSKNKNWKLKEETYLIRYTISHLRQFIYTEKNFEERIEKDLVLWTACVPSCFSPTLATLWTVTCQAPLSTGFSRQDYSSGLPCPPPGDLPDSKIKSTSLMSPALAGGSFTTSATWEAFL